MDFPSPQHVYHIKPKHVSPLVTRFFGKAKSQWWKLIQNDLAKSFQVSNYVSLDVTKSGNLGHDANLLAAARARGTIGSGHELSAILREFMAHGEVPPGTYKMELP